MNCDHRYTLCVQKLTERISPSVGDGIVPAIFSRYTGATVSYEGVLPGAYDWQVINPSRMFASLSQRMAWNMLAARETYFLYDLRTN